jgi:hypothetical protein
MTALDDFNAAAGNLTSALAALGSTITGATRNIPIVAMPGSILIVPGGMSTPIQTVGSGQVSESETATMLQLVTSAYASLLNALSNIQKSDSDAGSSIIQNLKQ